MEYIINPYNAKDISLVFYGALHEMDNTCKICQYKRYKHGDVVSMCPEMKSFCSNQMVCHHMIMTSEMTGKPLSCVVRMPKDAKSWNIMCNATSDDELDFIPIFHKDPDHARMFQRTAQVLSEKKDEIRVLKYNLQILESHVQSLSIIKNNLLDNITS